ncbi:hypothetical protein V8F20_012642 [Naviculisporaceae sp. PSN 640]
MKTPCGIVTLILLFQGAPATLGRVTGGGHGGGGHGSDSGGGTGGGADGSTGGAGGSTGGAGSSTGGTGDDPDAIPVAHSPGQEYPLGQYANDKSAPFERWDGKWGPYFSEVDDILKATPTKTTISIKNHHQNGHGVTVVVDQTLATKACDAWSTLSAYCGGAGTSCACYSGTYYVPDQWNTLAGYCAQKYIEVVSAGTSSATTSLSSTKPTSSSDMPESTLFELVQSASAYATYCPTTGRPTVAFGAVVPTMTSTTSWGSASITTADLLKWKIVALASSVILFTYTNVW